eukprot:20339-Eustigmatos_ZCMA.PRE.1
MVSGAERQFEARVLAGGVQPLVFAEAHEPHREHQAVAADLRDQAGAGVDAQAYQLEGAALRQVLLELAAAGHHFLRRP